MRTLVTIVVAFTAALAAVLAAAFGLLVYGTRTGNRRILRVVTRIQRDVLNPGAMTTAGTPSSPYAVVEHVGRISGKPYETPVGLVREGDEWFVGLVYGEQTSWAQNIATAGAAVIRIDGERHRVDDVRIVPLIATPFATRQPRTNQLFGIRWAVRMTDRGPVESE